MGMIATALVLLARLTPDTSFTLIYVALILIGIGISFFSAPNTSIIMGAVPENKRGMAAASNSIMRNLGMQCSIILCGSAFLLTIGNVRGIPPEQYGNMLIATKVCYSIFAAICIVGMVISLKRPSSETVAPG
jgi:MFS family permease